MEAIIEKHRWHRLYTFQPSQRNECQIVYDHRLSLRVYYQNSLILFFKLQMNVK